MAGQIYDPGNIYWDVLPEEEIEESVRGGFPIREIFPVYAQDVSAEEDSFRQALQEAIVGDGDEWSVDILEWEVVGADFGWNDESLGYGACILYVQVLAQISENEE